MTFKLRSYQKECLDNVYHSLKKGNKCIVVQSPPRTGKTVIMAEIARRTTAKGNRILFIVHRKEIVDQVKRTFAEQNVKAEFCQIGMVQTFTRNIGKLAKPDVILVDEAHHALAKTYVKVLDAFPEAVKLLFTATPVRMGRIQLDQIATDLVEGKQIQELMDTGFLAPFRYFARKKIDDDKLKKSSTGDFTVGSMTDAIEKGIYQAVVNEYRKRVDGQQAVVYWFSVETAKLCAQAFKNAGISAEEIDGDTPPDVRDRIVDDFRDGKVKILTNVNLFTEGIDLPNVDCVIMARPTQSLALFLQFAMRCLNPRDGKTATIIDMVGNWERHGLPSEERDWSEMMHTKERRQKNVDGPTVCQCPECMAVWNTKAVRENGNTCLDPECEHNPVIPPPKRKIHVTEGEIEEINTAEQKRRRFAEKYMKQQIRNNLGDKDPWELQNYQECRQYAALHGYKDGWAYHYAKNHNLPGLPKWK